MDDKIIKVRVRLIIIKNNKILLSYNNNGKYYFYIGGKLEFGETLKEACFREIKEECNANFIFKKIIYIRDFILPEKNEHSVELFILGDIDKYEEIDGIKDEEFLGENWQTWVDINKLPEITIFPKSLTKTLLTDYSSGFSKETKYLGKTK